MGFTFSIVIHRTWLKAREVYKTLANSKTMCVTVSKAKPNNIITVHVKY